MSEQLSPRQVDERIREMARVLQESKVGLLQRLANHIGMEKMEDLFQRTQAIVAAGGMETTTGERQRTPGGIFFHLTRDFMTPSERRKVFRVGSPRSGERPTPPKKPKEPKPAPTAPQPPTLEQVIGLMRAAANIPAAQKGRAVVKTTVIGRPKQIKKMDTCTLVVMGMRQVPALPKGLPPMPDTDGATVVVFIAAKQWQKVESALKSDPADELIVEGYPAHDPARNLTGIWAQSCTTKGIQRAVREQRLARGESGETSESSEENNE